MYFLGADRRLVDTLQCLLYASVDPNVELHEITIFGVVVGIVRFRIVLADVDTISCQKVDHSLNTLKTPTSYHASPSNESGTSCHFVYLHILSSAFAKAS